MPILSAVIGLAAAFAATAAYMLPGSAEGDASAISQAAVEIEVETPVASTDAQTTGVAEAPANTVIASIKTPPEPAGQSLPGVVREAALTQDAPVQVPAAEDPRWAKATAQSGAAAIAAMKALMADKGQPTKTEDASGVMAYASPETEAATLQDETSGEETASVDPAAGKIKAPEDPMPDSEQARVNTAVNMRSGPGSGHGVILVIPGKAAVQLYGCDSWCKVGYDGRTGYIYKSFLGGKGKPRASISRTVQKRKTEETVKTVSVVSSVEDPKKPEPAPQNPAANPNRGR